MPSRATEIGAVVLAGGRAERLGGVDKGLIVLAGTPLAGHVLARITPQVDAVVLSANRNLARYAAFGHPVVEDDTPGYPGPLAGILAGCASLSQAWCLVVPCDTPFLPSGLGVGLLAAAREADSRLARASDGQRGHYAVMLMHRSLLADMRQWLAAGEHRLRAWQDRHRPAEACFADANAFLNINTDADLMRAEALLARD